MRVIFSNTGFQGVVLIALFTIFVILPNVKPEELGFELEFLRKYNTDMVFYIIHVNSLLYILLSAFVLFLSIGKDIKQANKIHIGKKSGVNEAERVLNDFFEDKINLKDVEAKSDTNEALKNVLKNLKYGGIEEDLILGIDKIHLSISVAYSKLKNDYEYLATIMPIIGMIGTVAGLLIMFAEPTQAEDFEKKFAGLSLALSTTLYASLITILFFKPWARKVDQWQNDLDQDFQMLEIATRKFYHKVNMAEFHDLMTDNSHPHDGLEERQDHNDVKNVNEAEEDAEKEK